MIDGGASFDEAIKLAEAEVDRALSSSPPVIREYTSHLTVSRGKFIRAAALLSCAENSEGQISADAVSFAAAIELLHLATLVHDDVIDDADKRRGVVTLQKKYGKKNAVICGDYLLCAALKTASAVSDREKYLNIDIPDYMSRVCLGELRQNINIGNFDLSAYGYMKIILGKTAALFEASFFMGAVICGANDADLKKYTRLGRFTGMIFQLTDDCMDYETPEFGAKKPVRSDYEQGVITLPLIYAFENTAGFKDAVRGGKIPKSELSAALKSSGGLDFTRSVSAKYREKAVRLIDALLLTGGKRARLLSILDKAYARKE